MIQNKFYVLRGSEERALSSYSYNPDTGESESIPDTYGYPVKFFIGSDDRPKNVNIKPVFVVASGLVYSSIEVLMYDKDNNYLGYVTDSFELTQGKQKLELFHNTYSIDVNVKDTDDPDKAKIWFYVGYEVIPHYKKLELKNEKESGQMFFRESIDGSVKLFGDDYRYVKTSSLEQILMFAIFRNGEVIAKNIFNKTNCKFDHAKGSVELKLSPEDKYTKILDKYGNNYDVIKLAPKITSLILTKRMAYQIYISGANNITTVANGTYWEEDVNEPISSQSELQNRYYFSKIGDSLYEIHLDGFNYSINASYVVDKDSDTWNANSKVTVWENGEQHIYSIAASIKIVKIYSIGDTGYYDRRPYILSDDTLYTGDLLDGIGKLKIDIYRIRIFTGPNGTGNAIYESDRDYCIYPSENGFKISAGQGKYPMTKISQASPLKDPQPATFNLGDDMIEYGVYCRIVCDIDQVQVDGTTYTLYDLPSDDFVYSRANYKKCIGLTRLDLHQVKATSEKPTKYGTDDYGSYFTSNFLGYGVSVYGRPIPVSRSSWANTSIWVTFNENWTSFENKFRKEYVLKDAYDLSDVISSMLNEIDPTVKHEGTAEYSQFLYGDTSPLSFDTARNGYRVYIAPKSNVLKGNYDQAAQKANLTFEQLMNMLRDCFKCYWFIDEQSRFRIEHITYFLNGMSYEEPSIQFDLTQKLDKFNNKKALYCQQEIEFDKSDLSSRYEFKWMDDSTDLFGNNSIDVNSNYIQQNKTENITPDVFSSDVDLMLYTPDKFSSDGFALLIARKSDGKVPIGSTTQFKDSEYRFPYSAIPQNFFASWLYLMRYYMYDMPASNISYDGIPSIDAMRVAGIKRCMKHEIEFPSNQISIDIDKLITTEIGDGYIEEMSTNIDTNMTKIELRYEPE